MITITIHDDYIDILKEGYNIIAHKNNMVRPGHNTILAQTK